MDFTDLERAAIEQILSKPVTGMDALRKQFAAASVVKREYTGVGFYTTIAVPRSVCPVGETSDLRNELQIGATATWRSDPRELITFSLWLDGGYLACLEGLAEKSHSWPDEEADMQVRPTYFVKKEGGDEAACR